MASRIRAARSMMNTLSRATARPSAPSSQGGRPRNASSSSWGSGNASSSSSSGSSNRTGRTFSSTSGEGQFQTNGMRTNPMRTRGVTRNGGRAAAVGLAAHARAASSLLRWMSAWEEFDDT